MSTLFEMPQPSTTQFCTDDLWDADLSWDAAKPRFTDCFLRTLPVYAPAAFLWIFGGLQLLYIACKAASKNGRQKQSSSIPFCLYNVTKFLVVGAVIVESVVQLGLDIGHRNDYLAVVEETYPVYRAVTWADLVYSIVNAVTFTFLLLLLNIHRRRGYHTSGIVWLFSFASLVFALPSLYTFSAYYRSDNLDDNGVQFPHLSPRSFVFFVLHFVLLFLLFLLVCVADRKVSATSHQKGLSDANNNNGQLQTGGHQQNLNGFNNESNGYKNEVGNGVQKNIHSPPPNELPSTTSAAQECPDQSASFLSLLTFWWLNALTIVGYRKALTLDDLPLLSSENLTDSIAPQYDEKWFRKLPSKSNSKKPSEPGVLGTILRAWALPFAAGALLKLGTEMVQFINPQLQKIFITFISNPDSTSEPVWHGYFLAVSFFVVSTCQSAFSNHYFTTMNRIGMQIKTALISAIYRKSLKLSNRTRRETTSGEIINLMAVDVQRLALYMPYFNLIWSDPLLIAVALYFLWLELGPSVLAGFAVMILMIPLNATTTRFQGRFQERQMKKKDERVKVINEILNGIKVIKVYGWELPFIGKVASIRNSEVQELQKMALLNAFSYITWTFAPFLVSLATFAAYVLSSPDHVLDAKKAFVSLSLFEMLRLPLNTLPEMITQLVMAMVSIKRLNRFLNASELEQYVTRSEDKENAITIESGSFAWDAEEATTLSGIDLKVPKGSLVAIVGQVGSGKSSLLSAMLGDMEKVGGSVNVARGSSVAYVAQQAWIRNATLRDNVLFGSALQSARYQRVIEMCALKPDLAILPGGDQVEIGEKGINLSGGQKQRVAIARACYDTADVVLLDDPLSAVDSHVAKHLFAHVLSSKTGFLKDRTRVLATNNISILPEVDRIVVLSTSGTISEVGSYRELMANSGKFAEFVREHNSEDLNKKEAEEEREKEKALREKFARSTSVISTASSTASSVHKRKLTINGTLRSLDGFDGDSAMVEPEADSSSASKKLIQTELAETGGVKLNNYITYFKSYTWTWCAIILLGFVAKQLAAVGSNVWLAVWSNDKLHGGNNGTEQNDEDLALRNVRLGVYAALGVTQGICVAVGSISLAIATIKSSVTFHRRLFDRIMRSPMRFFDTTPLGRIVNRFSKDIDTVDTAIPYSIEGLVFCLLEVVATIIYIAVQVPVFLAAVLPTLILYYFIQKFYLATSRQLKRLESITRSPIYSHFGETLSGVATIRAYGLGDSFTGQSNAHVDTNQRCYYPNFIANRWLALRLEFCGNLIIIFAAIFAVIYRESFQERPGFVGLIITYSFTVTLNLNWMVRMTSEMETNVVSVERISEYCQLEVEREWRRPENRDPVLPVGWPREGEISFVDYSVRYREGLDLVLSDVSVDIGAGEKIGIVGRTGSGKSTLTLALFRILEAAFGCIKIDGVEVGRLGLHELRGILSIIPQDPVLFSGTIRSNLDPFSVYSDAQLWEALGHAHLAEYIRSLDAGLEYVVAENGENLSIGQRQLICLARALLRRTKILVLDEATAAIDLETDALIQETIRREFAHCTVLTIAHRLNTILDSTRVLVMDAGRVLEFDTPEALLANTDSSFYSLAKDAGLV